VKVTQRKYPIISFQVENEMHSKRVQQKKKKKKKYKFEKKKKQNTKKK
jgi:hypothetical protein